MNCPNCGEATKVVDSRQDKYIKRRRECLACGHRFNTYEIPESLLDTIAESPRVPKPIKVELPESVLNRAKEKTLQRSGGHKARKIRKDDPAYINYLFNKKYS